jgi:PAS domain S-box-containing protein
MVEQATSSPPAQPAAPVDGAVNILLVDDEPRNLDVLESILQAPDRLLVRAVSAEETLLALIQREFVAIVLDVQMPGMNGFELAKVIKQRKRTRHIPIIFLTAYYQEETDVLSGYDLGAVDYLTKPVNPRILQSKINVFVELSRIHRALLAANRALEQEIVQRQEAQLAMSRLAAIVESSSDAILSRNLDGNITTWNQGAERLFGYTAAEILGRPYSVLLPADRSDEQEQLVASVKRGEMVETFETVRMHKDGRRLDVSVTLSTITDAGGVLTGVSSIIRDISERKRLEAEVLRASEQEQHRIAQDLHDGLGQQLAGISCLSNTLEKELRKKAPDQAAIATRISKLLDVTVGHSRALARGLHPIEPEPNGLMVALEELATGATELFKVDCCFRCPQPALMEDYAAATHLYRIAQEAVANAIKHGRAHQIEILLSSTSGRMVLTVRDDGKGVPSMEILVRQQKGIGLRIMRYRAGKIGADLEFQRNDSGGIDLICSMPTTGEHEARPENKPISGKGQTADVAPHPDTQRAVLLTFDASTTSNEHGKTNAQIKRSQPDFHCR